MIMNVYVDFDFDTSKDYSTGLCVGGLNKHSLAISDNWSVDKNTQLVICLNSLYSL